MSQGSTTSCKPHNNVLLDLLVAIDPLPAWLVAFFLSMINPIIYFPGLIGFVFLCLAFVLISSSRQLRNSMTSTTSTVSTTKTTLEALKCFEANKMEFVVCGIGVSSW